MEEMPRVDSKVLAALVVGTGFSGLYQLHCLRDRLGISALLLEAGAGVGGTWYWTNMPVAIEQHVEWITDCIAHQREHDIARIEARPESMDRWVQSVNEAAEATLLPHAHHSWYLGGNVPGKPRVFMPYAGGMIRYRGICEELARKGYEGFALSR
jgi:cation diffusion facilitator CzcD-associated flavoprotein CzcO